MMNHADKIINLLVKHTDADVVPDKLQNELVDLVKKIKIHSAINMWLSLSNMSKHTLIEDVFTSASTSDSRNLCSIMEDCDWDLSKFITRIDENQRGVLVEYIVENYEGTSFEYVEEFYLTHKN